MYISMILEQSESRKGHPHICPFLGNFVSLRSGVTICAYAGDEKLKLCLLLRLLYKLSELVESLILAEQTIAQGWIFFSLVHPLNTIVL